MKQKHFLNIDRLKKELDLPNLGSDTILLYAEIIRMSHVFISLRNLEDLKDKPFYSNGIKTPKTIFHVARLRKHLGGAFNSEVNNRQAETLKNLQYDFINLIKTQFTWKS